MKYMETHGEKICFKPKEAVRRWVISVDPPMFVYEVPE